MCPHCMTQARAELAELKRELQPDAYRREAAKLKQALQADDEAAVRRLLVRWEGHAQTMGRLTQQERNARRQRRQGERIDRRSGRQAARESRDAARTTRVAQTQATRTRAAEQRAERRETRAAGAAARDALRPGGGASAIGPTIRDTASRVSEAFADVSGRLFGGGNDTVPPGEEEAPAPRKSLLGPLALGAVAIGGIYLATKGAA